MGNRKRSKSARQSRANGRRGKSDAPSALRRQLTILAMLPRYPKSIDTQKIASRLSSEHGMDAQPRMVQRDLSILSTAFPIGSDETVTPYRWFLPEHAPEVSIVNITPRTALLLLLVEKYLGPAVPGAVRDSLVSVMEAARTALSADKTRLGDWFGSVRVISRHLALVPPKTPRAVLDAVTETLLQKGVVELDYAGVRDDAHRPRVVHPYGLVLRDGVVYVVGVADDEAEPKIFALHRAREARSRPGKRRRAKVDLDQLIAEGRFGFQLHAEPVELELWFSAQVARSVAETPLAEEQDLEKNADGSILVRARMMDTQQLRAWLLGYGEHIEVRAPGDLRRWMAASAQAVHERHKR